MFCWIIWIGEEYYDEENICVKKKKFFLFFFKNPKDKQGRFDTQRVAKDLIAKQKKNTRSTYTVCILKEQQQQ